MQVLVNQKSIHCTSDDTLESVLSIYCQARGVGINDIAVAQGDSLIPRSLWSDYRLSANASFSVFTAVAGG